MNNRDVSRGRLEGIQAMKRGAVVFFLVAWAVMGGWPSHAIAQPTESVAKLEKAFLSCFDCRTRNTPGSYSEDFSPVMMQILSIHLLSVGEVHCRQGARRRKTGIASGRIMVVASTAVRARRAFPV
jgi:hypothetical protein